MLFQNLPVVDTVKTVFFPTAKGDVITANMQHTTIATSTTVFIQYYT
jgi:hypothetical protein